MTAEPNERPEIMLIGFDGKHYLIEGEQYLEAVVMGNAPFPTPIYCVHFETIGQLVDVFGEGFDPAEHWKVTNRAILRLRDEGALLEKTA